MKTPVKNIISLPTKIGPFIVLCVLVLSPFNCCYCGAVNLLNCNEDIIHQRGQPIEAMPILNIEIPADADLTAWDNWDNLRMSPIGTRGANVFVHRFDSIEKARANFDYECNHGSSATDWNKYGQSSFTYGGEEDNRYCASYAVEWRYDPTSFCIPSGQYESYAIFQKRDVVIGIYELEDRSVERIGMSTNIAIRELADELFVANADD